MAVYEQQTKGYQKSPQPSIPGGERQWIERELSKLQQAIQEIIKALEELRAQNP